MNIVVNMNSFSDLNIIVNATLKYYNKQTLNKKLKLMDGAMKYLALWSPGLQNIFLKNL